MFKQGVNPHLGWDNVSDLPCGIRIKVGAARIRPAPWVLITPRRYTCMRGGGGDYIRNCFFFHVFSMLDIPVIIGFADNVYIYTSNSKDTSRLCLAGYTVAPMYSATQP